MTRLRWAQQVVLMVGALAALLPAAARAQEPAPVVPTDPTVPISCAALTTFAPLPVALRVELASPAQIAQLRTEYDVWSVDADAGVAIVGGTASTQSALEAAGFAVRLDLQQTAQVQAALRAVRAPAACADSGGAAPAQAAAVPGIPGFACYRRVAEIEQALHALAAAYPTLARVVDIGDSWEKVQNPAQGGDLLALVITNQQKPGPKDPLVLMAAIHARELATSEAALRFAEGLLAAYGTDPNATWMLDYGVLHLLPMANPDGRAIAEQGILWRKNTNASVYCGPFNSQGAHGVDLNRNSTFMWGACTIGGCSSSYACDLTYRGVGPASEPETQAIQTWLATVFAEQRPPALTAAAPLTTTGLFLSLHSFGQVVLRPWGYTDSPAPNEAGLQAVGDRYAEFTGYRSCQTGAPGCLYGADGTTDDWTYATFGVPTHTIEMGQAFFESCTTFDEAVFPALRPTLTYALRIAHQPYLLAQGPLVRAAAVQSFAASTAPTAPALTIDAGAVITLTASLARHVAGGAGSGAPAGEAVAAGRWTLDAPPWRAAAHHPLLPTDGAFDGTLEQAFAPIDTAGWAPGRHTLFVQGVDAAGNGGAPFALFVDVRAPGGAVAETPAPPRTLYLPLVAGRAP